MGTRVELYLMHLALVGGLVVGGDCEGTHRVHHCLDEGTKRITRQTLFEVFEIGMRVNVGLFVGSRSVSRDRHFITQSRYTSECPTNSKYTSHGHPCSRNNRLSTSPQLKFNTKNHALTLCDGGDKGKEGVGAMQLYHFHRYFL
jgi:hypothetical protein